jgi:UDPglucose 6-dehydrogenase/GDP-mannose 6-dehydrogenase
MPLLQAVLTTNQQQPDRLVEIVRSELGDLAGTRIAVLGLAFKPDTGDIRETPAFPVIEGLNEQGAVVVVHDPVVALEDLPETVRSFVEYQGDLELAVKDTDAVIIVTRWDDYLALPGLLAGSSPQPLVVDGRRMLPVGSVLRYAGIGL